MENLIQLAIKLTQLQSVKDLETLQQQVATLRPLSSELEGRIMQKLRLDWNYHSNAIEGNPMTYGETVTYLMYGLTAKGKTLKDHLDIRGHNEAIYMLLNIVKDERNFTESDIRELHKVILVEPYKSKAITPNGQVTEKLIQLGQYKQQPNHVRTPTGEIHYYATPEDVPILMSELMSWYNSAKDNPKIHPSVLAAIFHHRFVAIHPFDDGNGRLGRILMNLILMQKGCPPAIVKLKDRDDYYVALNNADAGNYSLLVEYIVDSLKNALNIYLRAAKGERVEEMGDIDKELSLFVRSFGDNNGVLLEKSDDVVFNVLQNSIFPFLDTLIRKLETLAALFSNKFIQFELNGKKYDIDSNGNSFINALNAYKHLSSPLKMPFETCRFTYNFEGFKKGVKLFDLKFNIYIRFDKMQYAVVIDLGLNEFTYAYSQMIDPIERIEIIEKILKALMTKIQKSHVNS